MKKILSLSLFASLALLLAGCTSHRKSDLEESGMKGNIKQMTELVSNYSNTDRFSEEDPTEEKTEYDLMRILDFYPNGNLKSLRMIQENGASVKKFIYGQDSLLTETQYFEQGKLLFYEIYSYNSKGFKESIAVRDTLGTLLQTITFKYDKKGNKVEQADLFPQGQKKIQYFRYDKNGRLTEKTTVQNGVNSDIIEKYQYDENGNLSGTSSEDKMFDSYTMSQKFHYKEIDSVGNWTYRETEGFSPGSKEGLVVQTWERTIEYY